MDKRLRTLLLASLRALADLPRYFLVGDSPGTAFLNALIALRRWPESMVFHISLGRLPNYLNPRTYNDKVQWRKLFDRNELFVVFCDKVESKRYATALAPEVIAPEILWSGTDPDAIPFDDLEPPYVLKASNRSSANEFVWSEEDVDPARIREECRRWMGRGPHRWYLYEWAYGRVPSRIIVERAIDREDRAGAPADHKVFIFGGET